MHSDTIPFPAYDYERQVLLDAFEQGPARLAFVTQGLTDEQLRAHPRGPERWSIQEIVIHTADSEIQGAFRIRKVVAEPRQVLPAYDQDRWAEALGYGEQPRAAVDDAIQLLHALRRHSVRVFRRASEADWACGGTHQEFGPVTLGDLLALYADHTERHVDQILESRRLLGIPITLRALLPKRLF